MTKETSFEQTTFTWRKWVETQQIHEDLLHDFDLEILPNYVFPTMMARLTKRVLTQTLAQDVDTITLTVPATWWDHFKIDHGRKWLGPLWMRHRPPRMIERAGTVHVDHLLTWPEQTAVEFGGAVRQDMITEVRWDDDV